MLTHDKLTANKWKREHRRRRLKAFKRRLQATYGPRMGEQFYRIARKGAKRRGLVEQFKRRFPAPQDLPKLVPLVKKPSRLPFWRKALGGA